MLNIDFNFYGFMILLSIFLSMVITYRNALGSLSRQDGFNLLLYELIGIVFGGKYYTLFTHYTLGKEKDLMRLGMSSLGSLIGLIIMILIFIKLYEKKREIVLNIIAPSIPLMYGLGKIGCFLTGCCRGFIYNGFGAVTYNYSHGVTGEFSYFPIQLIEAVVFLGLFVFLMIKFRRGDKNCFSICLILSCCLKFWLEFGRLKEDVSFLNVNQIVCLLLLFLVVLSRVRKKIN